MLAQFKLPSVCLCNEAVKEARCIAAERGTLGNDHTKQTDETSRFPGILPGAMFPDDLAKGAEHNWNAWVSNFS